MLQFRLIPNDAFLLIQLEGLVSLDAWQQVLAELESTLAQAQSDRLVLDLRGLLGWLGTPERRSVGAMMATHFARMHKVALVIQAEKITGVVEAEARRLGCDLKLFSNFDEAAAWVAVRA